MDEPTLFEVPVEPTPSPAKRAWGTTVASARRWLRQRLADPEGVVCPVCDRHAQMYRRKITAPMVRALGLMAAAGADVAWTHMPSVVGAARADEAKLAYWGLLEEERRTRPDGGRAGYWRVTGRGMAFLRNELSVPEYALVYAGQCIGHAGDDVLARDCVEGFDLGQLLHA